MNHTMIDISRTPFSRYGAYLALSQDVGEDGRVENALSVYSARRRFDDCLTFKLTFGRDEAETFTASAVPEVLTVKGENGTARLYFRDDDTVVIDSEGLDLRLQFVRKGWGTETGDNTFRLISESYFYTYTVPCGIASMEGNAKTVLSVACENGRILMAFAMRRIEPKEIALPICPDEEIAAVKREWEEFLAECPVSNSTLGFTHLTWYTLWSCFARAEDVYVHDTVMMSKKFMSSTWSWDHCFNALALARMKNKAYAKEVAMNQFLAPFFLQSERGLLPDMWNPELETRWATTKPPIHGWCFSKLMKIFDFEKDELEAVYRYLEKWTNWWMLCSDTDHDGIPDYPDGCDSGWDNSTLFDIGHYLESPDLPAFLILQMKALAEIAQKLGNTEKERHWNAEAEALTSRLMAHSLVGGRFVAKRSGTHEYQESPTSLLSLMPLVLGDMLSPELQKHLSEILERDFLTDHGLATEMPRGEKYQSDGYWRGPIWAPSTYLLVDGLRRGGHAELAKAVAQRYCHMTCEVAKGNYENFDALTGKGLRAQGYTWSASVYLLFCMEYGL